MSESTSSSPPFDRRQLLKGVMATGVASGLEALTGDPATAAPADKDRPVIEGYTGRLSYQAGDEIGFHISTSAKKYALEIIRVGACREVVWTRKGLRGTRHVIPANASSHGCKWPAAFTLEVPKTWPSGYYRVLLRGDGDGASAPRGEMFFVIRAARPGRDARILLQLTTNTYNAYNNWGGTSLYGGPRGQGTRVSFDRPYAGFLPGDKFTTKYSGWRNWEQPFVQWAERAGYAIDFAVNSDLEFHPEILKHYRLVLSVGHDEYWSSGMRDSLEAFIANGGNVAFFSGNTAFWQVRSESKGRALVSWKQNFTKDPVYTSQDHKRLTGMWSNRLVQRPENSLTGVSFAYAGYHRFFEHGGDGCYTIHRPDHWIFAGTGLKRGDKLGGKCKIVGYECDGCQFKLEKGLPVPTCRDGTPKSFVILGTAPAGLSTKFDQSLLWVSEGLYGKGTSRRVKPIGAAVLGCYVRGGTVVTTGCTEWVRGLAGRDRQVERITRNVLERLAK
jgi:hypothetical protein